jgi:hypothetical protein
MIIPIYSYEVPDVRGEVTTMLRPYHKRGLNASAPGKIL